MLDIGTSVVAEGKVRVLFNKGQQAPEGWLLDPDGTPTTDPGVLYKEPRGSILPLGGSQAYKGFGIGLVLDMLVGGFSGAPCSTPGAPNLSANAVFFLVLDIDQFTGAEHFLKEASGLANNIKSCPKADGVQDILVPGEPERRSCAQRRQSGIPLDDGTWKQLASLAERLKVSFAGDIMISQDFSWRCLKIGYDRTRHVPIHVHSLTGGPAMHLRNVSTKRRGMGMYELIVVLVVLAFLAALLIPAIQKLRGAATLTQSINNLKQIALASHSFHDANKRMPFNGVSKDGGNYFANAEKQTFTSGTWGFQISSYIDQGPLFQNVDRDSGIAVYMCPGRGRPSLETSNGGGACRYYFFNNSLHDSAKASKPDNADNKRTLVGITDGTSNTIMYGHGNIRTSQYKLDADVTLSSNIFKGGTTGTMRAGSDGQTSPKGVTLQRDSDEVPAVGSWGGPFPQGCLMAMCDATVRIFPYTLGNLGEFLTPQGGEVVNLPDT